MTAFRVTTNVEHQTASGDTKGFIAPADSTDPERDAEDVVYIPCHEDEREWERGLDRVLLDAGWKLAGPRSQDGPVFSTAIVRTIV